MVEYYLKIQEYRFGDRITSELTIDSDVDMKARILPLTLQPFVENAFVHGLEEKACDARLVIHVYKKKDDIFIEIRDNGKGMDAQELAALQEKIRQSEQTGKGIGLGNISRRISMLYQNGAMHIYSRPGHGTVVRFEIPQAQKEDAS